MSTKINFIKIIFSKLFALIGIMTLLLACNNKNQKQTKNAINNNTVTVTKKPFPKLQPGEVFLKNKNPFGKTIELTGKNITGDTAIFKLKESEMLVKSDLLVMKNLRYPFRIFQLPTLKQIIVTGKVGNGPDEFNFPTLVATEDTSILCYIYENTNSKLYKLDKSGQITFEEKPFHAKTYKGGFGFGEKQMTNLGKHDFIFVDKSATGKSIFRIYPKGDSIVKKEVFNLGLNPKRKSQFAYIGSFAVNLSKNRMVYAYKYFKILKFMDLEGKKVRTINFEKETFDDNTLYQVNGLDKNISHYWKVSAQDDYVYFLYIGRTPYNVVQDGKKGNKYIFVEQYDWNGNPIKKYKLDQWGYFFVDEKRNNLYLTSFDFDEPFIEYRLPEIN